MRKIQSFVVVIALLATACMRDNTPSPGKTKTDYNNFDYGTVTQVPLTVDYGDMGGIRTSVYFELYDTMPVAVNASGTGYVKLQDITPFFADYTDASGRYTGTINLPSYAKTVYIYTPAFNAQTILEAPLVNGQLSAVVETIEPAAAAAVTRATYESRAVSRDGWKTWLGTYDTTYGRVNDTYTDTELKVKDFAKIYKAHASVFDTTKACPEEYRSSRDMLIDEAAEVAVTFLGGNTCWNSSMGYYYYPEGQKPASLAEANVIMIFPNTQDGEWSNNRTEAKKRLGTYRGTAVQLKYYPNIASGSRAGETTAFPAGYRIGFVLATNAWTYRLGGNFNVDKGYRAATSSGLSIDNSNVAYQTPRTAVFRYTDKKNEIDAVLFSFEDHVDDENFSDVVFTMVSNPIDAVVDIPEVEVNDQKRTTRMLKGIYAFEDLWPSQGDYDMNDVMVGYNYEKTFSEKGIYEETFLLKTYMNSAGLENGLAATLAGAARNADLECGILTAGAAQYEPVQFVREGDVLLLTANVKDNMGATYKITAKYDSPVKESAVADIKPFIFSNSRDNLAAGTRWEVHIPYEAPTAKLDQSLLGSGDDRSIPSKGIYYVRNGNYPFAFFLAGANDKDVAKLLDAQYEKTHIDELFPGYTAWVASGGKDNTNWYK